MVKRFYIETYGCQMNVADSEVVASILEQEGLERRSNLTLLLVLMPTSICLV